MLLAIKVKSAMLAALWLLRPATAIAPAPPARPGRRPALLQPRRSSTASPAISREARQAREAPLREARLPADLRS